MRVPVTWDCRPQESSLHSIEVKEAPISMLVPMWALIGASLYFGMDAGFTANTAETAATLLLGGNG